MGNVSFSWVVSHYTSTKNLTLKAVIAIYVTLISLVDLPVKSRTSTVAKSAPTLELCIVSLGNLQQG